MRAIHSGSLLLVLCSLAVLLTPQPTDAIVLHKCDIVKGLQRFDKQISRTLLSAWTCVIMNESGGDTRKITTANSSGSSKYGVFHLESGVSCEKRFEGGKCNARCSDLLTDEIDQRNIDCAVKFFNDNGFKGWSTYDTQCKKKLPSISECLPRAKTV